MIDRLSERQRQAIKAAAAWYAMLCAGELSGKAHDDWQQWLHQHADHQWAWQRVEALQSQLQTMPGHLSYRTLNQAQVSRRNVLKSVLLLLGVGSGWPLWHSAFGINLRADYHTATGEIRRVPLSDGSVLTLNTASAVQVDFSHRQRAIRLIRGEIAVTTAVDPQRRPFLVTTTEGVLQALGTTFSVRLLPNATLLAVQQHAVKVRLHDDPAKEQVVNQQQTLRFSATALGTIASLAPQSDSWTQGLLSVSNRRLAEVIEEVARYRPGMLLCDDSAADIRVSGTFSLQDTDRLLTVLAQTLPVRITTRSRYWVRISAA